MSKNRKKQGHFANKRALIPVVAVIAVILIAIIIFKSATYGKRTFEAGEEVLAEDFFRRNGSGAEFTDKSDDFDISVPGTYTVYVKKGLLPHKCKLIIEDTIAPTADGKTHNVYYNQVCEAIDMVDNLVDATEVVATFVNEPDFTVIGNQDVTVLLTDRGGNTTTIQSVLCIIPVVAEVVVEAGGPIPSVDEFVLFGTSKEIITTNIDTAVPGKQKVRLKVDGFVYESVLNVVDTKPPVVEVQNCETFVGVNVDAERFIVSVDDATEVTASFDGTVDTSKAGTITVNLVFTDGGGNKTAKTATLTVKEDNEPPVITAPTNIYYFIGDTISYRNNVTVTDNSGEDISISIDDSKVNLNVVGTYQVVYTATDPSGNTTTKSVDVVVAEKTYDVEVVYEYADRVLENIFWDGMSDYEKLWAIYEYVYNNVGYIDHSEKIDWVQGAYEGLVNRAGDCWVYACTTKVLLDRAGIVNMDICKIPTDTRHYWNLVDIGEGWHHLDTTPRVDGPTIFYWDEATMMEYSRNHNDSHNYDHSAYPVVP